MISQSQQRYRTIRRFVLVVALLVSGIISAQGQKTEQRPVSEREKAILEHERRIQQILDQRKTEREAEQKRLLEEKQRLEAIDKERARQAAARTGSAGSRTAVSRGAAGSKAPQFTRTSLAPVVLYIDPLDSVAKEGEQFSTEVRLFSEQTFICDSLGIVIAYDRNCIEPVRVYDHAIRPLLVGKPEFSVDHSIGVIRYSGNLAKPQELGKEPLLTILWQAQSRADWATIRFLFGADGTRLDLNGADQLGTTLNPEDGTISGSVSILPKNKPRARVVAPTSTLSLALSDDWENMLGTVNLRLQGPARNIKTGEVFFVDVNLSNPYQVPCDNVSLSIRFDPEKLEVIDYDRGNWISLGTNILDSFAHESFPFNYHKKNESDNIRGEIVYDMGLSTPLALPTGAFARIKFRAKAPTESTDVWLARSRSGSSPTSDVSYLGQSLLPSYEKKRYASAIAVHITQQR